ncbi:BamA/TamA family outer membrane protein [Pajaroellobacter abortibovis]|nr:BamA/TamA family outer membrane protein [Pajaroellobacter abortibovis]
MHSAHAQPLIERERPSSSVSTQQEGELDYILERIEIKGDTKTLGQVIRSYFPRIGKKLNMDHKSLQKARYQLLTTGFFRDVQFVLQRGSQRGYVILTVYVSERNTLIIQDVWLGFSRYAASDGTAQPFTLYGGIEGGETNLMGTGMGLGGALAGAQDQIAFRTRFSYPRAFGTPWMFEAQVGYNGAQEYVTATSPLGDRSTSSQLLDTPLSYKRSGGEGVIGQAISSFSRLLLQYRLEGIDANLPEENRGNLINNKLIAGKSILSACGVSWVLDTRDDPFLPTKGEWISAHALLSTSWIGSSYQFIKVDVRASRWFVLPWKHIFRVDGIMGLIEGEAPIFENFYVADFTDLLPHRVLDLNFDRRSSPNLLGTSIETMRYGEYAGKLNIQYRWPIYRGHRSIYGVDLFGSTGVYTVIDPEIVKKSMEHYRGINRVPIDFTFNFGLQMDTVAGGFTFGLSNFVGLVPFPSGSL